MVEIVHKLIQNHSASFIRHRDNWDIELWNDLSTNVLHLNVSDESKSWDILLAFGATHKFKKSSVFFLIILPELWPLVEFVSAIVYLQI